MTTRAGPGYVPESYIAGLPGLDSSLSEHNPPDRRLELFFPVVKKVGAPARQTTVSFFPVVIMIVHPPDRRLEFFFLPVVITIMHPPDRRLELFFSGHNEETRQNT